MKLKFCTAAATVGWQGQTLHLRANTVWPADDPFVVAHPEMFADAPELVESSTGVIYRPIEQASAAPGEKRATQR